jgi:hypothetical protein
MMVFTFHEAKYEVFKELYDFQKSWKKNEKRSKI